MYLTRSQIEEINSVQLRIFERFLRVCHTLGLRYYMVHGSLLGTVRVGGFLPFDDDIDVAMPRADYNRLIDEGQLCIGEGFFIQSYRTEDDYPLAFAKIRADNTAFIQPIMSGLSIHQGIYIDVFPIDFCPESPFDRIGIRVKDAIYRARISRRLRYKEEFSFAKKIAQAISLLLCPSFREAVRRRAELFSGFSKTDRVITVGGKASERCIPEELFGEGIAMNFEGLIVTVPSLYQEYLDVIYGDFQTYDPTAKYMHGDVVEVSADRYSTEESYLNLIR